MKINKKPHDVLLNEFVRKANTAANVYDIGRVSVFGSVVAPFIVGAFAGKDNADLKIFALMLFFMMFTAGILTCQIAFEQKSKANKQIRRIQSIMAARASR